MRLGSAATRDRTDEAIISTSQHKTLAEYQGLLTAALCELQRILKHGGKVTLVFHSASAEVWRALQGAYRDAGFAVECAGVLDKTQGSFKQVTTRGAVRGDPLLLLAKSAATPGNDPAFSVVGCPAAPGTGGTHARSRRAHRTAPLLPLDRSLPEQSSGRPDRRRVILPLAPRTGARLGRSNVFVDTAREQSRAAAHAWERTLPTARRKQLGQYFTGLPLGRLLAHLALSPDARTVLDPMAGHGDLLDAVWEASAQRGVSIARLDGVEVDSAAAAVCRRRLASIAGDAAIPKREIVAGDAFTPATIRAVPERSYDLVITNPPYVRYQVRGRNGSGAHATRAGLRATLAGVQSGSDAHVWRALAQGYSGLADLSVPAWLLAAAMVRPSGRLALVVPATWRSREYADVIRYLLLRCFELECIVADRQPGWFSEALVRTHLLVARRLSAAQSRIPICDRTGWSSPPWVEIAPQAAAEGSLVGAVPGTGQAEASFASRLYDGCLADMPGVSTRPLRPGARDRSSRTARPPAPVVSTARGGRWRPAALRHCTRGLDGFGFRAREYRRSSSHGHPTGRADEPRRGRYLCGARSAHRVQWILLRDRLWDQPRWRDRGRGIAAGRGKPVSRTSRGVAAGTAAPG